MKKAKPEVGKRECLQLTEGPTETNRPGELDQDTQASDWTSETQEPNQAMCQGQNLHWQQERSSIQLNGPTKAL